MAKKGQKETHLQRLVKSLNTIGTARTPISSAYPAKPKKSDVPRILQPKAGRNVHTRILVPSSIDAPNLSKYASYGKGGWNKAAKTYALDYANYQTELKIYNKSTADIKSAQSKQRLVNKIRNSKSGLKSVITSLKGSRSYGKGRGSRS